MTITYNDVVMDVSNVASLQGVDAQFTGSCNITYLTARHVSRKDFDPLWRDIVTSADVVFHEEFAWSSEKKFALHAISQGDSRYLDVGMGSNESYSWQRLKSVAGTGIRQEFWDVSEREVSKLNLRGLIDRYHEACMGAEDAMRKGAFSEALTSMHIAHSMLGEYDSHRDTIGVQRIIRRANTLAEKASGNTVPRIVVFAGAAHIFQAVTIAKMFSREDLSVSVRSLIQNPFGHSIAAGYASYLSGIVSEMAIVRSWLGAILTGQVTAKNAGQPGAFAINEADATVEQMSDEEACRLLRKLA